MVGYSLAHFAAMTCVMFHSGGSGGNKSEERCYSFLQAVYRLLETCVCVHVAESGAGRFAAQGFRRCQNLWTVGLLSPKPETLNPKCPQLYIPSPLNPFVGFRFVWGLVAVAGVWPLPGGPLGLG